MVKLWVNIDKWGSKKFCDDKDLLYYFIKFYFSNRYEIFWFGVVRIYEIFKEFL